MFPVERKNEFLKYVMITESYDEWSDVVFEYIENNNIKNWKEGFDFVIKYDSDPPWAAYWMLYNGYAEPEWVIEVIENTIIGNPLVAAYSVVEDGHATKEWCQEIKRKNSAPR